MPPCLEDPLNTENITGERKKIMSTKQNAKQSNLGTCSKLLAVAGAFTVIGLGTGAVIHADEVEAAPTPLEDSENLTTNDTAAADDAATDTETKDAGIPESVNSVTQDEAVSTIDDAQKTLADEVDKAKESGVVVNDQDTETVKINDQNATDKTNEMLKELNDAAQTVIEAKDAMNIINADQKALAQSAENMEAVRNDALALIQETANKSDDLQSKITITSLPDKDYTPEYVSLKGLTGQALRDAIHQNQLAYSAAVAKAISDQDKLTADLRKQLEAYRQALADYESGASAKKSGIAWADNTTVVAETAQKMTGNEQIYSEGDHSLRQAAIYAIQSVYRNQNTDATFNNIFKINGTGSVWIRNTSNGDVRLTFSNINAPGNIGTYVAIWGKPNGAIAWGVFALIYGSGTYTGGGEGGSGGGSGTSGVGNILTFVHSYDFKVETTGEVATFTFNDIDNNQTISNVSGINASAAKIEVGKNVTHTGENFSAGRGDVSQASGNILDSNSVRWSWNETAARTFVGSHSTSANNPSIVAGIFGEDSMISIVPKAIELTFEKGVVTPPVFEVSVPHYEVETTPNTPVTPESPVTPDAPVNDQSVNTAANLDLFTAEMMASLAALGGVLVGSRINKRKSEEQ